MYIVKDVYLPYFEAWQGGKDTLDEIVRLGYSDELEQLAEEVFEQNLITETDLNDWLWFDRDIIYEQLGITQKIEED